jgi:hypothetical protein
MANGTETLRERMWRAARADVAGRHNPLEEMRLALDWMACEVERRDKVIEELRAEVRSMRGERG